MNTALSSGGLHANDFSNQILSHQNDIQKLGSDSSKTQIQSKVSELNSLIGKIDESIARAPLESDRVKLLSLKKDAQFVLLSLHKVEIARCKGLANETLNDIYANNGTRDGSQVTKKLKSLVITLSKVSTMSDHLLDSVKSGEVENPRHLEIMNEMQFLRKEISCLNGLIAEELALNRNQKRQQQTKNLDPNNIHQIYMNADPREIKNLMRHIKTDNKNDSVVFDPVKKSTIKSPETIKMEKVFNSLVTDYKNTSAEYKNDDKGNLLHVTFTLPKPNEEKITLLPSDLKKIDYNQINVTEEHLAAYENFFLKTSTGESGTSLMKHPGLISAQTPSQVSNFYKHLEENKAFDLFPDNPLKRQNYLDSCSKLHNGHKIALTTYTSHSYQCINCAARGKSVEVSDLFEDTKLAPTGNEGFKQGFLNLVLVEQALQKLPNAPTSGIYSYRGEKETAAAEKLMAMYESAVKDKKPLILRQGFLSTGEQPAPDFSDPKKCKAFVIIKGYNKKDISHYSLFPRESERINPETHLHIQGFKRYQVDGKEVIYIVAKAVNNVEVYNAAKADEPHEAPRSANEENNNPVASKAAPVQPRPIPEDDRIAFAALVTPPQAPVSDKPPVPFFNPKLKLPQESLKAAVAGLQIAAQPKPVNQPQKTDSGKPESSKDLSDWIWSTLVKGA